MNPENQNQGYGNTGYPDGQQPTYPNNNYQGTYQQPQQQGYANGQYANGQYANGQYANGQYANGQNAYQQQPTQPTQPAQQTYAGQPYQYTTPQPGNNKKVLAIIAAFAAVAIIAVIAVFALGGGSGNSPSGVVEKFVSAVNEKDANKFMECLPPDVQSMLKLYGGSQMEDMMDGVADSSDGKVTVKIIDTKEDGDTAEVECEMFIDGESQGKETVDTIKVDGTWYINFM